MLFPSRIDDAPTPVALARLADQSNYGFTLMKKQQSRFWRITLHKRGTEVLIGEIPITHITQGRIITLLKMLFAKHTLTDEEIVVSNLRADVKKHRNLMTVCEFLTHDPISFLISDGSNWVHAIVVRPEDQPV